MDHQFKRILDLVRRTGDRLIITDSDGHNAYVVMDLDQYETLIDLEGDYFDDELPDSASNDLDFLSDKDLISESVSTSEKIDMMPPKDSPGDIWQAMKPADSKAETWDINQMGDQDLQEVENQYKIYKGQVTKTPISRDPAKKPVNEEEFGEDQFYLEPID